jgi:1,4-alpha-glucan branching enzyme
VEQVVIIERADGVVSFRIYLPDAEAVLILGDFTNWRSDPILMHRTAGGWWEAEAQVPPGDHLFSYLADGERWIPDYAAHGLRANRYGGWVSHLSVQGAPLPMAA